MLLTIEGCVTRGLQLCDYDFYIERSRYPKPDSLLHATTLYAPPKNSRRGTVLAIDADRSAVYALGIILLVSRQHRVGETTL